MLGQVCEQRLFVAVFKIKPVVKACLNALKAIGAIGTDKAKRFGNAAEFRIVLRRVGIHFKGVGAMPFRQRVDTGHERAQRALVV